jgi:hypothetical protein
MISLCAKVIPGNAGERPLACISTIKKMSTEFQGQFDVEMDCESTHQEHAAPGPRKVVRMTGLEQKMASVDMVKAERTGKLRVEYMDPEIWFADTATWIFSMIAAPSQARHTLEGCHGTLTDCRGPGAAQVPLSEDTPAPDPKDEMEGAAMPLSVGEASGAGNVSKGVAAKDHSFLDLDHVPASANTTKSRSSFSPRSSSELTLIADRILPDDAAKRAALVELHQESTLSGKGTGLHLGSQTGSQGPGRLAVGHSTGALEGQPRSKGTGRGASAVQCQSVPAQAAGPRREQLEDPLSDKHRKLHDLHLLLENFKQQIYGNLDGHGAPPLQAKSPLAWAVCSLRVLSQHVCTSWDGISLATVPWLCRLKTICVGEVSGMIMQPKVAWHVSIPYSPLCRASSLVHCPCR